MFDSVYMNAYFTWYRNMLHVSFQRLKYLAPQIKFASNNPTALDCTSCFPR